MYSMKWIFIAIVALFFITLKATAMESPDFPVKVSPPFSDRLFPYITYDEVWERTPVKREDVAVPNVFIIYGHGEDRDIIAEAGRLSFYLGNWVEDIGFHTEDFVNKRMPRILATDNEMANLSLSNFIVIGANNRLIPAYSIKFVGPSVMYRNIDGKKYLFVGGKTRKETLDAIRYMADVRLNFKSGAYKTFFNFVKLKGYLESKNWDAALETIESPVGLSACGKNMAISAPSMMKAPEKVRDHIAHRNDILYTQLPGAVRGEDRDKAANIWHEAMTTCYGCHQGLGNIPKLRKFKPLKSIHAKHQRIAARFSSLGGCEACHMEETRVRGYDGVN